jgi:hypothetical protein
MKPIVPIGRGAVAVRVIGGWSGIKRDQPADAKAVAPAGTHQEADLDLLDFDVTAGGCGTSGPECGQGGEGGSHGGARNQDAPREERDSVGRRHGAASEFNEAEASRFARGREPEGSAGLRAGAGRGRHGGGNRGPDQQWASGRAVHGPPAKQARALRAGHGFQAHKVEVALLLQGGQSAHVRSSGSGLLTVTVSCIDARGCEPFHMNCKNVTFG